MKNIKLPARAKLNLNLHLLPSRGENGYFPVRFVNTELSLHDEVCITSTDHPGIDVKLHGIEKSGFSDENLKIKMEDDLSYMAAKLVLNMFGIKSGVSIEVKKVIPVRAGLGGGSSDAAAVIKGLDELFDLRMTYRQKLEIAKRIGMDVCYSVIGGLCMVMGYGETVVPLPFRMPEIKDVLLVIPRESKPSTAWAYSIVRQDYIGRNISKINLLIHGIATRKMRTIYENIWNDFELSIVEEFPVVGDIIGIMKRYGATVAALAGSGLTVFGVFEDRKDLLKAKEQFDLYGYRTIETSIV